MKTVTVRGRERGRDQIRASPFKLNGYFSNQFVVLAYLRIKQSGLDWPSRLLR